MYSLSNIWRKERLGLLLILSSLIAIMVVLILFFRYQQLQSEKEIRTQGLKLVGLLAEMDYDRLTARRGQRVLDIIFGSQSRASDIAYVAVVKPEGQIIAQATDFGVVIPAATMPGEPVNWFGQRQLQLKVDEASIIEFYAPLLSGSELLGFIRLGYFQPAMFISWQQLSFIGTMTLPVFLLAVLFYVLMRREIRPLGQITQFFDQFEDNATKKIELTASGELGVFIQQFNHYLNQQSERAQEQETHLLSMEAATKVLSFKRSKMEGALQAIPDGLVILDNNGVVSFANNKLQHLLGIEPQSIVGESYQNWCDSPELRNYIARSMQSGIASRNMEKLHILSDDHINHPLTARIMPLPSPHGPQKSAGRVIVLTDALEEQLAKNSRAEFVGHVSHELKTPLNTMALYSETLMMPDLSASMRIEAANVINSEVIRLADLINNLLNITKIESGSLGVERSRVKLRDLLQDCFEAIQQQAKGRKIQFQLDMPKDVSPVALDKNLIRVAINNLLTNAVKYSNEQGQVVLRLEESPESILISVKDNGIGIADDEQSQIFERFYRSDRDEVQERNGHGLGLALTKDIINLHHGRIWVESAMGEGTEFHIELNKEADFLKHVDAL